MDDKFSFRHIIKSFVPGFFATISFLSMFDIIIVLLFPNIHLIRDFLLSPNTMLLTVIVPVSLFVGIIINSFSFIYIIPKILKTNHIANERNFHDFNKKIIHEIKDKCFKEIGIKTIDEKEFNEYFDCKTYLLEDDHMGSLEYIRNGYWYYMEFQINSIVVIVLANIAFVINMKYRPLFKYNLIDSSFAYVIMLVFSYFIIRLLWKSAVANYKRNQINELSLIIRLYSDRFNSNASQNAVPPIITSAVCDN